MIKYSIPMFYVQIPAFAGVTQNHNEVSWWASKPVVDDVGA